MQEFWFYVDLGFKHVLDFGAYDHILFLAALATPFTFKKWKKVVLLATIFTIAHCTSLALSAFDVFAVDVGLIEFLIPVTIFLTALFNLIYVFKDAVDVGMYLHSLATAFFGLIHGFGFSNYFKLLMAEEEDKVTPLLGFATGIEFSQVAIILIVLGVAYIAQNYLK
ncbi:MAG: HupE/UreJ family protein, partial [Bacteroidota bacterium]